MIDALKIYEYAPFELPFYKKYIKTVIYHKVTRSLAAQLAWLYEPVKREIPE